MKRRILLVDDEVAVLLTLKAVLEISGFDVDTAASAREGKHKIRSREYEMVISDMRMEHDEAGVQVIEAARSAVYQPAVALLTAFPVAEDDWQDMGADKMLVKPMQTRVLLQQIEKLLNSHQAKKDKKTAEVSSEGGARESELMGSGETPAEKKTIAEKAAASSTGPKTGTAKKMAGASTAAKKAAVRTVSAKRIQGSASANPPA